MTVSDYRYVEYSRHAHRGAGRGTFIAWLDGFDAFIASLNAGTLTGAPKAAVVYIDTHEHSRRGYWRGVGYLTFSGQLDTGIIIQRIWCAAPTAMNRRMMCMRVGATLLYDSSPPEYAETEAKAGPC